MNNLAGKPFLVHFEICMACKHTIERIILGHQVIYVIFSSFLMMFEVPETSLAVTCVVSISLKTDHGTDYFSFHYKKGHVCYDCGCIK